MNDGNNNRNVDQIKDSLVLDMSRIDIMIPFIVSTLKLYNNQLLGRPSTRWRDDVREEKQRLYRKTTHIQASPYGRREKVTAYTDGNVNG
jgi:two-component SAPR family response regulator